MDMHGMHTSQPNADTYTHAHTVVWLQVEHWAYWRPQLIVLKKSIIPQKPKTTKFR